METRKEEVVPVMANVPPELEQRMPIRHDYGTNDQALMNRRNSPPRKVPPTSSYGVDPATGQPDPVVYNSGTPGVVDWTQENEARGPPSRKPTASYGYDPITEDPDQQAGLLNTTLTDTPPKPSNASTLTRDIHVPGDYPKDQ